MIEQITDSINNNRDNHQQPRIASNYADISNNSTGMNTTFGRTVDTLRNLVIEEEDIISEFLSISSILLYGGEDNLANITEMAEYDKVLDKEQSQQGAKNEEGRPL